MSQSLSHPSEVQGPTQEQLQEARIARRCFTAFERLTMQLVGYPPGHPAIEQAAQTAFDAFNEYFQHTDRLSTQVHPHSLVMLESHEEVWQTEEPKDYCFLLSRDGIFLLHILAGIDVQELKRLASVFNRLIDLRNDPNLNSVVEMFEANFRYVSYDALDESLAALAGIELDMRNRDTKEEQELIDDLFNKATKDEEGESINQAQGNYQIRVQNPADRIKKIDVGSREFLAMEPGAQARIMDLKRGFTEHKELEHREGEILSAILGAQPKEQLRVQAVSQIGEVMGSLVTTEQPWESLTFLKIIHHWRDRFAPEVTHELKAVVQQCFTRRRIQELVRQIITTDRQKRRMILQMFNALHLEDASKDLAAVVGWNMEEEAREDIIRYLKERARYGFDFLEDSILEIPAEVIGPILEILETGLPASRPLLIKLLKSDREPPVKARALKALQNTWSDAAEIRAVLVPLAQATNSELRVEAVRQIAQSTPQHIYRVCEPLFSDQLRGRPEEEVRELALIFVQHGGPQAIAKLDEIIHRRGLTTSEQERELAVRVTRALLRSPQPAVIEMLESIAKDWLVPQQIRSACKEVAEMLSVGTR